MKKILLLVLFVINVYATEHKVVFDLVSANTSTINKKIFNNIKILNEAFKKQGDTLKVAVVISGKSYKYFLKDIKNSPYKFEKKLYLTQYGFQSNIKNLSENYGVVFEVCSKGMAARKIPLSSLYEEVKPAFNKHFALIKWQNKGYAYILVD